MISSGARADERAWWAADDPSPFLVAAGRGVARSLRAPLVEKPSGGSAAAVREQFEADAAYWRDVYDSSNDVDAQVYRERLRRALEYVDGLGLPHGAPALDVGAGAGVSTVALAERGFDVTAVDSAVGMLELTKRRAAKEGVSVTAVQGDAHALPIGDASVDVVVALGLLPWVEDPVGVLREFARVLRPGGIAVLSSDNRWRLNEVADPALSALAGPLRRRLKSALLRARGRTESTFTVRRHSVSELRDLLQLAGFEVVAASTLGWGYAFMRRPLLSGPLGVRIAAALSRRGESRILRPLGVHVVASARLRALTSSTAERSPRLRGAAGHALENIAPLAIIATTVISSFQDGGFATTTWYAGGLLAAGLLVAQLVGGAVSLTLTPATASAGFLALLAAFELLSVSWAGGKATRGTSRT